MIDVNEYEIYKKIEDLPVKTRSYVPKKAVVIKGVIQILHGMCEYKERYLEFIEYMNDNGYICVINDMRGHGENVSFFRELGFFGIDGHKKVVKDTHAVTVYIKNNFPDLPLILMGHSMGTFVAKEVLKKYDDDYDKVILLGSPSDRCTKILGLAVADILALVGDDKKTSRLLDALVLGKYQMKYRDEKLKNSWLCSDTEVVNKYNENMYSNFSFTVNGYYTLLKLMCSSYSKKDWKLKNIRLPILFMAGKGDPCILSESKFENSVKFIRDLGYFHTSSKLYDNMRHEILNEKDKHQVYNDMLEWLKDEEENICII